MAGNASEVYIEEDFLHTETALAGDFGKSHELVTA